LCPEKTWRGQEDRTNSDDHVASAAGRAVSGSTHGTAF